jgi:hypothetical protein
MVETLIFSDENTLHTNESYLSKYGNKKFQDDAKSAQVSFPVKFGG